MLLVAYILNTILISWGYVSTIDVHFLVSAFTPKVIFVKCHFYLWKWKGLIKEKKELEEKVEHMIWENR